MFRCPIIRVVEGVQIRNVKEKFDQCEIKAVSQNLLEVPKPCMALITNFGKTDPKIYQSFGNCKQ